MKIKRDTSRMVRATREGRLYIKTSDFFKDSKVQELIVKLKDSSIYEDIEEDKKRYTKDLAQA
ncbi:MAG: hypothetical protein JKY09_05750 [Crocinitomicaceae bacterium]|nr:hypothetical protein [Crocinitomicaceae bacterium]